MNLTEFEAAFNDRLAKLDDQFSTINDVLKVKKEAFVEMYRRNPKICHDEAVSLLQTTNESFDPTNPGVGLERDAKREQLTHLQEQLAEQHEIATEAEELKRQLADQKAQLENKCHGLEQRLDEEKVKSQTLFEAIINLQAYEKDLESQLEEKEEARHKLESEKNSLEKKWDRRQEDLVQTNDKLVKTQKELTDQEKRNDELQSALDNVAREKSNLIGELQKVNSDLQDEIEKLTRELDEDSEALLSIFRIFETEDFEARASEAEDSEALDSETGSEIRRLKGNLKEIQTQLQKRNEELQSALDNEASEKSSLIMELVETNKVKSNLHAENQKMTNDLIALTSTKSEADDQIKRLKRIINLDETQAQLRDAEFAKAQQTIRKHALKETKQIIVCRSFSDDNTSVDISSCKRAVRHNDDDWWGYCFLDHPEMDKNQILKWSLRIPKILKASLGAYIGKVIILE